MTARVVMVLGGGGAKAAAHLGAARALHQAGLEPVHWIGTSMGGVMAAALASGADLETLVRQVTAVERHDVLQAEWTAIVRGIWAPALMKPAPLRRLIESLVPARSFAQLRTPCTITAVEVRTGREITFGAGGEDAPLLDVLTATCALPPYFPPVMINGRAFYDGGLRSAVPIDQAAGIDCTCVVAIHTAPGFDEQGATVETPPPLLAATDTAMGWLMAGTVELQRARWTATVGRPPLIWLRPTSDRGAMFAADRTAGYVAAGFRAMQDVLEELE